MENITEIEPFTKCDKNDHLCYCKENDCNGQYSLGLVGTHNSSLRIAWGDSLRQYGTPITDVTTGEGRAFCAAVLQRIIMGLLGISLCMSS